MLAAGCLFWRLVQSHAVAAQSIAKLRLGYLACVGDRLFGSSVKAGSAYTSFDGPAFLV